MGAIFQAIYLYILVPKRRGAREPKKAFLDHTLHPSPPLGQKYHADCGLPTYPKNPHSHPKVGQLNSFALVKLPVQERLIEILHVPESHHRPALIRSRGVDDVRNCGHL